MRPNTREAAAKAALLNHLRGVRGLRSFAVISELSVDRWKRRADLVTVGAEMTAYEIKTSADRLCRLEGQITAYSAVFDRVYAVLATKHLEEGMRRIPDFVGVKELCELESGLEVRPVREAQLSSVITKESILQLLPVSEIVRLVRAAMGRSCKGMTREQLLTHANALPIALLLAHLRSYLKAKHERSTGAFAVQVGRRRIVAADLERLSVWRRPVPQFDEREWSFGDWVASLTASRAFGPIPEDIGALLSAQA